MFAQESVMDIQKEREAFEKHASKFFTDSKEAFKTNGDQYLYDEVIWMWDCWIERAKAQAVPEGFVLVKKVHPDAIVHNQGLGLFKECQIIYGWDGKSKDFKDALNKGFYHGVKLGAKAVLETAMIEAQEPAND